MLSKILCHRKLLLVLFIYLIFAISYSIVVPIGRGADEWAHYWYAQFIAQNGRLPLNPAEREAAGYKSDWPPLYHLFAAGVTGWIETDGPPTFKYREDYFRRQLIPAQGPEAILHTEDELFPWRQEILNWHLGRFLSIGFTLGTLLATYFVAVDVFSTTRENQGNSGVPKMFFGCRTLATASVAVLAFNPRFLFTGMLFSYDGLTLLLTSLFLWLVIRIAKGSHLRWGFGGLGVLAGLALVTKYLTALLPVVIVVLAFVISRHQILPGYTSRYTLLRYLGQAALTYGVIIVLWFGYLLINFNEVEQYGSVLGTLAPLIRGDASDRTVEEIFAWLSGGQAPPPAYIEKQSHTVWQIMAAFPTTFWGNPVIRPYPLNWFIWAMTIIVITAAVGIILTWRNNPPYRFWINLLLLYCALPVPFMIIRLFGARDALEAVQGRHILFLAGPAVAVLLVWGLGVVVSAVKYQLSRFTVQALLGLLLTAAISQLMLMVYSYPPLLPVRTESYAQAVHGLSQSISLPGGASLIDFTISDENRQALQVNLIWLGGSKPAPEDYQMELALVDSQGEVQSGWRAYQTQARYPTRAWETGDVIRDEAWLPLVNLAPGEYEVRMRLVGEEGAIVDWHTLGTYNLSETISPNIKESEWVLWRKGEIVHRPPILRERETAQITLSGTLALDSDLELLGPDKVRRDPISSGPHWANFIINPDWPAGDYYLTEGRYAGPAFRVGESRRMFQIPKIPYPLDINFEGKIRLLGYNLPTRRVEPGEGLPITLYWQGLQWMGEDIVIFDRLLDNQQVVWGGYDRLPKENYSTLFWAPGEVVTDGFAVPVAPDTPNGVYTLSLGWYREINGQAESLTLVNSDTGEPTGETAVIIGPIKVGGPPAGITAAAVSPQTELNVILGEQIELLGYDANQNSSSLDFTFYWQALAPMETDYTVFAHVRNTAGDVVSQQDSPPVGGVYPTTLWDAGEIIKDQISVPVDHLESGRYEIVIGMYDFTTGIRLPIDGSPEETIWLQSFEVGDR